ncbi:52 kDa repressor of the inhibitor of the protein kinase-like [Oopsacas minuta]|uniref:52 kDa repressor of the inhibitor of the protein kinase-like n=1 Tax=Oopsacas minuta TaxID=111878 RepID=A0AAV7K7C3_9METZ|nr:52 kDa repressor of the inhibitor of the protein kinase-like [Oopsacas minuta]
MLCDGQNIPLLGDHDNSTDLEKDNNENHGDFGVLLQFRVKSGDSVLVISGEITDISDKEQLSLVLLYVDPENLLVREDLMSYLECDATGITGRCLSDKILGCLNYYGLDITKLRSQVYDAAGNVGGSIKGTAALINTKYPLAFYLHCASHSLNLAVLKSL